MKVLNLLTSGSYGGIEVYCNNIGITADYENGFCFLFGTGEIYDSMKKRGLNVFSLNEKRKLSLRRFFLLKKIAFDYDVIVVHHGDPFLRLYFILLKMYYPNKKYVLTLHSCFANYKFEKYGFLKRFLSNILFAYIVKKVDSVVSVSNAVKESYSAFLKNYDYKSVTIYNGIAEDILIKGSSSVFNVDDTIKILYVGRLSAEKGVSLLVDAVSKLGFKYELKLVGEGAERKELEKQVKNLGISDRVVFAGFQSDVGSFLEKCNIFVLPTLWESFGLSIVEAMSYGRVCVANAIGGIPEIIIDRINGYLCQHLNAECLSEIIQIAVDNIDNSDELRLEAQKTANNFSIANSCLCLKKHYSYLLLNKK